MARLATFTNISILLTTIWIVTFLTPKKVTIPIHNNYKTSLKFNSKKLHSIRSTQQKKLHSIRSISIHPIRSIRSTQQKKLHSIRSTEEKKLHSIRKFYLSFDARRGETSLRSSGRHASSRTTINLLPRGVTQTSNGALWADIFLVSLVVGRHAATGTTIKGGRYCGRCGSGRIGLV